MFTVYDKYHEYVGNPKEKLQPICVNVCRKKTSKSLFLRTKTFSMNGTTWESDVMEIVRKSKNKKPGTKTFAFTILMADIYSFRDGINFIIKNYEQQKRDRKQ